MILTNAATMWANFRYGMVIPSSLSTGYQLVTNIGCVILTSKLDVVKIPVMKNRFSCTGTILRPFASWKVVGMRNICLKMFDMLIMSCVSSVRPDCHGARLL